MLQFHAELPRGSFRLVRQRPRHFGQTFRKSDAKRTKMSHPFDGGQNDHMRFSELETERSVLLLCKYPVQGDGFAMRFLICGCVRYFICFIVYTELHQHVLKPLHFAENAVQQRADAG